MKRCLDCKLEKSDDEFYRDKSRADGREPYCKVCKNARRKRSYHGSPKQKTTKVKNSRKWYWDNPDKARATARRSMARFNRQRKISLLDAAGTRSCMECGYDEHPAALQFHHRDPNTKLFNVAHGKGIGLSKEKMIAEVAKCDVLCANCHSIKTCTWERGWE